MKFCRNWYKPFRLSKLSVACSCICKSLENIAENVTQLSKLVIPLSINLFHSKSIKGVWKASMWAFDSDGVRKFAKMLQSQFFMSQTAFAVRAAHHSADQIIKSTCKERQDNVLYRLCRIMQLSVEVERDWWDHNKTGTRNSESRASIGCCTTFLCCIVQEKGVEVILQVFWSRQTRYQKFGRPYQLHPAKYCSKVYWDAMQSQNTSNTSSFASNISDTANLVLVTVTPITLQGIKPFRIAYHKT